MLRAITAVALILTASTLNAATLSVNGPAPGLTHIVVDQPYGQLSKVGLPGGSLLDFSDIWTDASQLWLTDLNGVGSLHTIVTSPQVSEIAVRTYAPEEAFQEFSYEYHINTSHGLLRQELGPITLPYGAASLGAVPEPSTALLGLMGAGVLWVGRRR